MANNAVKVPLFRAISANATPRSFYSSQGKLNPIGGTISEIKKTQLSNKLVVAAADTGSPITRLSFIFKAGPRYEVHDNLGASHHLRLAAGLATKNSSSFAIVRNLQQVGASLTCTQDRETIAYTLSGTYDAVKAGSSFLSDIISCPVFKPWELEELVPRMKVELASMAPEVKVMELLHAAAYREGLGNSLFAKSHRVGKLSPECLQYYAHQTMCADRGAVVGLGIGADELVDYAQGCNLASQSADHSVHCQYHGGMEARRERGGDLAYVAVAGETGGMKDWLVCEVLKNALGTGPRVQWGNESGSSLGKLTAKFAGSREACAMSAFNCAYSDSGLFGIMLINGGCSAGEVVNAVANQLRSPNLSDKDIERAKQITKMDGLLRLESGESCILHMGRQALFCPSIHTPREFEAAVDKISAADVKQVADRISKSKLTMASVGNLSSVPYLDQLK